MIDFLGIGAQKSGTTWLMKNLGCHPGIWTPWRFKELHYFDVLYLGLNEKTQLNRIRRRIEPVTRKPFWKKRSGEANRLYLSRICDPEIAFSDAWYAHIFSRGTDKVQGEFTPAYCGIGEEGVAHVKRLMPDVKLIYMIRDPYERALSSLRMLLERDRVRKRSAAELVALPVFGKRGDYAKNIPVWEAAFAAAQILYIPFGRVKSDPLGVLRDVEAYLGLEPFDKYPMITEKVNATGKKKVSIPAEVCDQIRTMTGPQYPFLAERFGEEFLSAIR